MDNHSSSFPVDWENTEDAKGFWIIDIVHCPEPVARLDYDLRIDTLNDASNQVLGRLGVPMLTEARLINGFVYHKIINPDVAPEALPGMLDAVDDAVRTTARDLNDHWEKEWLPAVKAHLADLAAFDVGGASLPQLLAHLADLRGRIIQMWTVHHSLLYPFLTALADFDQAYRDLFPDAKPLDAYDLTAGFPNKTIEANGRLWELGREAARSSALRTLILGSAPSELAAALSQSEEGRALWTRIEAYAATYGERNDDLYTTKPSWNEDLTPVLRGLREAVLVPDRDLAAELGEQALKREARLSEVRAAIASHPRLIVEEFEALLRAAQDATVLSEDHHFWIDCKVTYHTRRVCLEVGRRLVQQGALDRPDDVFHFTLGELAALGEPGAPTAHLRDLSAARQAYAARFADAKPPTILGIPRPFLPMDCAVLRAFNKFSGNIFAPPTEGTDLRGMPGSAGKITGPARVVRNLDDAQKLEPGEILVAPFTLPSWTPFFASAKAVVTNVGGMLCHAAVVAREYGIPAVVGTVRATETLRDGQLIEVDGDAGVVRLLPASA